MEIAGINYELIEEASSGCVVESLIEDLEIRTMGETKNKENWIALIIAVFGKGFDTDAAIQYMRL